jgi:hypothetical protein
MEWDETNRKSRPMSEELPKRRRGRPPDGEKAMTAAERQRRARLRRTRIPRREFIDVARVEIQAMNWPMARIEEAVSAMVDGEQREMLLKCCESVMAFRKGALEALKKADRAT